MSTSSEFAVAANFASTNGLIIALTCIEHAVFCGTSVPLAWCSDFPNEKEYLFIQGEPIGMFVVNVVEIAAEVEYKLILKAISLLTSLYTYTTKGPVSLESDLCPLLRVILEHQLSNTMNKYERFKSFTRFANDIRLKKN